MLFDFSIIPIGGDAHTSEELAEALKIVHESGLRYQLTPSGTCIEGEWDEVMKVIRQCHDAVRKSSAHVVTTIKVEDDAGEHDKLTRNIKSVEDKVGRALKTN